MATTGRILLGAVALLTQQAAAGLYPGLSTANHTCSLVTPLLSSSEGAKPGLVDTCCAETYGGLVLSTQYWDTYTGFESEGQLLPRDTWSLHGLWPDFVNGSYTQYCDLSRQYDPVPSPNTTTGTASGVPVPAYTGPGIDTFLEPFGKYDLLAYMNKYWVAQGQANPAFWGHEFSKHATCFSSFQVECYGPEYVEHQEVVDFFETALSYYSVLPSWGWLSAAGIRPSNESYYSLADIQDALTSGFGALPYVGCAGPKYNTTAAGAGSLDAGYTQLSEVWYYNYVYGRVQRGQTLRVGADIRRMSHPSLVALISGSATHSEVGPPHHI
jgi:ribonuclease T2